MRTTPSFKASIAQMLVQEYMNSNKHLTIIDVWKLTLWLWEVNEATELLPSILPQLELEQSFLRYN